MMTRRMRRVTLSEFTTSEVPVELKVEERDALREVAPSITVTPARGESAAYYLTPASEVGVAQVGDLTIEIQPKLRIGRVLFLISYAIDRGEWRDESTDLEVAGLVDAVAPAFISHTRRAFRRDYSRVIELRRTRSRRSAVESASTSRSGGASGTSCRSRCASMTSRRTSNPTG